jgi:hypothetical protein
MKLQEEITRILEVMGLNENLDIDWSSKIIKPRSKFNVVVLASPNKIFDRLAKDNPHLNIRDDESLRIGDRLEKAKRYLINWGTDTQYVKMYGPAEFVPTQVYFDTNDDGSNPRLGIEDGRHRLLAALKLGLDEFPIEVSQKDTEYLEDILT